MHRFSGHGVPGSNICFQTYLALHAAERHGVCQVSSVCRCWLSRQQRCAQLWVLFRPSTQKRRERIKKLCYCQSASFMCTAAPIHEHLVFLEESQVLLNYKPCMMLWLALCAALTFTRYVTSSTRVMHNHMGLVPALFFDSQRRKILAYNHWGMLIRATYCDSDLFPVTAATRKSATASPDGIRTKAQAQR